ncbi:MAG: hypothetical protein U0575_03505 [Phycisphaerales bacterium]
MATASAVIAAAASGIGGSGWHLWHSPQGGLWLTYTDQGPPPPITPQTWRLFVTLASTYEKIGSNIPVSFAEWIVMNGITDPREQWCLMWLWWNLMHQEAVD